jgi:hypothetical protein
VGSGGCKDVDESGQNLENPKLFKVKIPALKLDIKDNTRSTKLSSDGNDEVKV